MPEARKTSRAISAISSLTIELMSLAYCTISGPIIDSYKARSFARLLQEKNFQKREAQVVESGRRINFDGGDDNDGGDNN